MKTKAIISAFVLSLFVAPLGLVGVTSAERGNGNSPVVTTQEAENETEPVEESEQESSREALQQEAERLREQYKEAAQKKAEQLREQAKKAAEAKKSEKTVEARQNFCEARKEALSNKIAATSAAALRHVEKFDSFKTKITDFAIARNITVDAALLADANSKSEAANTAAEALSSLNTEINCEDIETVSQAVSAYKTALVEARDALKAYRTSLVVLLVSVRTAVEAQDQSSATDTSEYQSTESSTSNNESAE